MNAFILALFLGWLIGFTAANLTFLATDSLLLACIIAFFGGYFGTDLVFKFIEKKRRDLEL